MMLGNKLNKVFVLAPHADDEILGCGGTIARHVHASDEVYIVVITNASKGAPELFSEKYIQKTRKEAVKAHKTLGVKETIFLDFPAPALNSFPEYQISLALSELFHNYKPSHLYLPHPGDLHQDHKAVYRSGLVAARPLNNLIIKNILIYETLSETEWAPMNEEGFRPTLFVDVSSFINKKINAMKIYKSQLKEFPNSRSIDAIVALSNLRGATVGVRYAEAFFIERQIIL